MILNTITESITYDEDTNKLTVKLRPVFEHLRQLKLAKKQEFSADIETLTGTLETRSEQAKQALKNSALNLTKITVIGTRKSRLNTKIEPHNAGTKKLNVDKVPKQEPFDTSNISHENSSSNKYLNLISILKQSTQEYYNIRMIRGLSDIFQDYMCIYK